MPCGALFPAPLGLAAVGDPHFPNRGKPRAPYGLRPCPQSPGGLEMPLRDIGLAGASHGRQARGGP
ncbi:hypothetical protein QFZ68_001366 [Streptomyces sp. V1I6]|nr:hypothetical protein [Streptomyces sp. V1I6]